jgi:hypothetical protein
MFAMDQRYVHPRWCVETGGPEIPRFFFGDDQSQVREVVDADGDEEEEHNVDLLVLNDQSAVEGVDFLNPATDLQRLLRRSRFLVILGELTDVASFLRCRRIHRSP